MLAKAEAGPQTESRPRSAVTVATAALAGIGALFTLLVLAVGQRLTWDEIEFVRATEWVRQGQVPFRDFWEHHSPLQWFVFAPLKTLARGPGTATVLFMRWAQLPLWVVGLWALWRLMRRAGSSPWAAGTAFAALLLSPIFVHSAIEYRVDTLANVLYLLALFALAKDPPSSRWSLAAGALLALAGLANLRMAPLLAATLGLALVFDPGAGAWRLNRRFPWIAAGALLALVPALLYGVATDTLRLAWQRLIVDNSLADASLERLRWGFWSRLLDFFAPLLVPPAERTKEFFPHLPLEVDLAAWLLLLGGGVGLVVGLRRFARAGFVELVAILQLVNLWFLQRMKVQYPYHYEIVLLLFAPLLAAALDAAWSRRPQRSASRRFDWRWLPIALLLVAATADGVALARSQQPAALRYQDLIMREADRLVPPDGTVFDGVGFVLNRRPAYRYWFLALIVRLHTKSGVMEPYTVADAMAQPPDAVIYSNRVYGWFLQWPALGGYMLTHYLPLYGNLWVPGLSRQLDADLPTAKWTVPRTGRYVVVADPALLQHAWFQQPLTVGLLAQHSLLHAELDVARLRRPQPGDGLRWELDGQSIAVGAAPLRLVRGQQLRVTIDESAAPIGVLVIPIEARRLFVEPADGILIDG